MNYEDLGRSYFTEQIATGYAGISLTPEQIFSQLTASYGAKKYDQIARDGYVGFNYGSYQDRTTVYDLREKNGEMIRRGVMPPLGNGFEFVIDHRPADHENDYIPAVEYTAYFDNGPIPIAAPGHRLHTHDINHTTSYQTIFSVVPFAALVRQSANRALADNRADNFASSMDNLGDVAAGIEREDDAWRRGQGRPEEGYSNFGNRGRIHLLHLLRLADGAPSPELYVRYSTQALGLVERMTVESLAGLINLPRALSRAEMDAYYQRRQENNGYGETYLHDRYIYQHENR